MMLRLRTISRLYSIRKQEKLANVCKMNANIPILSSVCKLANICKMNAISKLANICKMNANIPRLSSVLKLSNIRKMNANIPTRTNYICKMNAIMMELSNICKTNTHTLKQQQLTLPTMPFLYIYKMTAQINNLQCKLLYNLHSTNLHLFKINAMMLEHRNLVLKQCKLSFTLQSITQHTCKMNAITL